MAYSTMYFIHTVAPCVEMVLAWALYMQYNALCHNHGWSVHNMYNNIDHICVLLLLLLITTGIIQPFSDVMHRKRGR